MALAKTSRHERRLIMPARAMPCNLRAVPNLVAPKSAPRIPGCRVGEAVAGRTRSHGQIDAGRDSYRSRPQIAIERRALSQDARRRDLAAAVRTDRVRHRHVDHGFAGRTGAGRHR